MREFQQKKQFRRTLTSNAALVVLGVILFLTIKGVWSVYGKYRQSAEDLAAANTELSRLAKEQTDLTAATNRLKTGTGVEAEIRDKFQVAKDGEHEIVILDTGAATATDSSAEPSLWQRFLRFFGGN